MSVATTVTTIDTQTLTYLPAVIAGMQAAELTGASVDSKKQAVLNAVIAGSTVLASSPNPNVAAIAGMIDLFASIFTALGFFRKKAAVPATGSITTQIP